MTDAFPTASWGRRFAALLVDWLVSTLAVVAVVGRDAYLEPGSSYSFASVGVYVVEAAIFTWLIGGSFGKVVTGLRVVPDDGRLRPLNPLRLLARQAMVAMVIPPLVFKSDGRGLHDLLAGTATVKVETFRELVAAS